MVKVPDPWADILRPDHPAFESRKRANPHHPLDFFRGKDFQGRYVFWLEGNTQLASVPELPILLHIDTSLTEPTPGKCRLALTLLEKDQRDVFQALCANLEHSTAGLRRGEDGPGVIVVANRLRRWHDLLRRRRDGLLSDQQIIGLVGELLFLRNRALVWLEPLDAVGCWRGPYGDEQDFVIGSWTVEVKTQISSSDKRLRISSEDQLDTTRHGIILVHQTIAPADRTDPAARTLNQLIDELLSILDKSGADAADLFRLGLVEACWKNRPQYDEISWVDTGTTFFKVSDGFPRIIPTDLRAGVERVSYSIRIDSCSDYKIEEHEALRIMFDGRR